MVLISSSPDRNKNRKVAVTRKFNKPIERAKVTELLGNGYVDTFRHFYPEQIATYPWWSYRAGARPRNVGWRIDYFVVNKNFIEKVEDIKYMNDIMGSDHCPVQIER